MDECGKEEDGFMRSRITGRKRCLRCGQDVEGDWRRHVDPQLGGRKVSLFVIPDNDLPQMPMRFKGKEVARVG